MPSYVWVSLWSSEKPGQPGLTILPGDLSGDRVVKKGSGCASFSLLFSLSLGRGDMGWAMGVMPPPLSLLKGGEGGCFIAPRRVFG